MPTEDRLVGSCFKRDEIWTAALSIAANRASKIALLRNAGLTERADRYVVSLHDDVESFIAKHGHKRHCKDTGFVATLRAQVPRSCA